MIVLEIRVTQETSESNVHFLKISLPSVNIYSPIRKCPDVSGYRLSFAAPSIDYRAFLQMRSPQRLFAILE